MLDDVPRSLPCGKRSGVRWIFTLKPPMWDFSIRGKIVYPPSDAPYRIHRPMGSRIERWYPNSFPNKRFDNQ